MSLDKQPTVTDALDAIKALHKEQEEQKAKEIRHLSQMKTLLDDHLALQKGILAEFTKSGKANTAEMKKWREEMTRERKVLAKTLATHEAQIDRLSSYADGVFLSRRVYNSNIVVFICSLVANAAFIILTVILWLNK